MQCDPFGHLQEYIVHIEFYCDLFEKECHKLLALINGTKATQEMDQGLIQYTTKACN